MQIKFNSTLYDLVEMPNIQSDRFQATIYKGNYSLDTILNDIQESETIQVLNGEEIVGIYTGYSFLIALSSYYSSSGTVLVSIELSNNNTQSQIERLTNEVSDIKESISELTESQGTQDLAIEDLAEAVSDLTPEE